MRSGGAKHGGDAGLLGAGADQSRLGAAAQREAEAIQQDRLAGAGFAGQHRQARCRTRGPAARSARRRGSAARSACARAAGAQKTAVPGAREEAVAVRSAAASLAPARHCEIGIAVLVPGAAGIVVAEHRRGAQRLVRACRGADRSRPADAAPPARGWWSGSRRRRAGNGRSPLHRGAGSRTSGRSTSRGRPGGRGARSIFSRASRA